MTKEENIKYALDSCRDSLDKAKKHLEDADPDRLDLSTHFIWLSLKTLRNAVSALESAFRMTL